MPNKLIEKCIEDPQIQDIAPQILAIFGLDIPEDMDGEVKPEIYQTDFLLGYI